jgi:predicted lipoprotein with Yx(FWY)xxD motif
VPTETGQYTVNLSTGSSLGQYLVDGSGMTLYWTTADAPGTSNISGATLSLWPVFFTPSISVPPSLNASDFGSITRSDGTMQTAYKQWPLYYYSADKSAGDAFGQGVAGIWFVVNPAAGSPQAAAASTTPISPGY